MSLRFASRSLFRASRTRTITTLAKSAYTASGTATGKGRDGTVELSGTDELPLKLDFAFPKSLGGNGEGYNPEQLLALGYAGCFLQAVHSSAKELKKDSSNASVQTFVKFGPAKERDGFALAVDLKVSGVDEELLQAAHKKCPYSRAFEEGIQVTPSLA